MDLSANCDQDEVDLPAIEKGEDLGVRSGKWAAKVDEANRKIRNGNACNALQREAYKNKE